MFLPTDNFCMSCACAYFCLMAVGQCLTLFLAVIALMHGELDFKSHHFPDKFVWVKNMLLKLAVPSFSQVIRVQCMADNSVTEEIHLESLLLYLTSVILV